MRRLTFQRPITKWEYVQLHKAVRTVAEAPELGLEGEPSTRTRRTHACAAHAARTCAVHATLTDSPCYCCTSAGEPLSLQFIADPEDDDNHTLTLSGAFGEVPAFFWPNARSQAQKHASELAVAADLERLEARGGFFTPQLDWLRAEGLL